MFDVGFWELLLIGGLALVILGPERLPKVAREVGRWVGRARAMARQLRSQLEQEVSYDEYMKTQPSRGTPKPGADATPAGDPAATETTATDAPDSTKPDHD